MIVKVSLFVGFMAQNSKMTMKVEMCLQYMFMNANCNKISNGLEDVLDQACEE